MNKINHDSSQLNNSFSNNHQVNQSIIQGLNFDDHNL